VHRDLKPENIMVGAFGEVVVVDWGVAKRAQLAGVASAAAAGAPRAERAETSRNGAATLHGTRVGTPGWMAPEQERGDIALTGVRADVFGLGAILRFLLELASGRNGTPDAASTASPRVRVTGPGWRAAPRSLRAICECAMASDPQHRYPDAHELAADIDRFLTGEPVRAYREPVWVRAQRLYRKHRTAFLLVLSYLVMRVLLIAFG
jgi:eukaryotic-like serine/threonine-protein kinase